MPKAEQEQAKTKQRAKSRIPVFRSIAEEAQFWDTHSTTEFDDEFEAASDVQFIVTRGEPKKTFTVRLPEATIVAVTQEAQAKGMSPSTLVRIWILEHLRASEVRRR